MFENKFRYNFFVFFPCRHQYEQQETMCKRLHGLYWLNDLHCRDMFLERISIAHNGSRLTCNIKSHSGYIPKHATSQRGGGGGVK